MQKEVIGFNYLLWFYKNQDYCITTDEFQNIILTLSNPRPTARVKAETAWNFSDQNEQNNKDGTRDHSRYPEVKKALIYCRPPIAPAHTALNGDPKNVLFPWACGNRLTEQYTEGTIQERVTVTGRRESRRNQLLDGPKEKRGHRELKEEAHDSTMGRPRLGTGGGPGER